MHTGVANLGEYVVRGDVVVAAAGRANLVTPDMVKPGAAVVGAGVSRDGKRLLSDVDESVAEVAGWITPRIGGRRADDAGDAVAQHGACRRAKSGGASCSIATLSLGSPPCPRRSRWRRAARSRCRTSPIIPYIEGDGIGVDIWPAAQLVLDAAAAKHGKRVAWKEVLAGEKAFTETGEWLPEETVEAFRDHLIGIKGPLTTPVGGGIRSLNVALRQLLDLYVCLRPVRWFKGVPSPVVHPEKVDMVIFRENTEDVYAGLEVQEGTEEARRLIAYLEEQFGWTIRPDSGIGIKPISETGSKRLVRAALQYAVRRQAAERHARAQGEHPEVHRGGVSQLGLRGRPVTSSPTSPSAGTTAAVSPVTGSSLRTPSPTSRSSRC